jgi:hypothetical protein
MRAISSTRTDEAVLWRRTTALLMVVVMMLAVINYRGIEQRGERGEWTSTESATRAIKSETASSTIRIAMLHSNGNARDGSSLEAVAVLAENQSSSESSAASAAFDTVTIDNESRSNSESSEETGQAEEAEHAKEIENTEENEQTKETEEAKQIEKDAETSSPQPYPGNHDDSQMHIVFSATCNQNKRFLLQSLLQISATRAGQRGPITGIISGCSDEEKIGVLQEPTFYYDFRVHFTPDFSKNPVPDVSDDYLAYNKPFGLRHFLHNAIPPVKHDIITLLDIDFIFFRLLEVNTGHDMSEYYSGIRDISTVNDTVVDGVAMAQDWTTILGSQFYGRGQEESLAKVCDSPHQPCLDVVEEDAREYYTAIGPPYIMTRHDFLRMIDDYCDFCMKARHATEKWEAEMYAYSMAAANHGIKHTKLNNLGITHPKSSDDAHQYWDFTDQDLNPCVDPFEVVAPVLEPPVMIHHCELYGYANPEGREYLYWKHKVPTGVLDCDSPMIKLPPASEWDGINVHFSDPIQRARKKQEVWAECSLIKIMNDAIGIVKREICPNGFNAFPSIEIAVD